MPSVSCDLLIYHVIEFIISEVDVNIQDVFLSSSAVVGNEVLCFCLVQLRKTVLCMCQHFKNESSHNFNKPPTVDPMKLEICYSVY
jgi:hypothetical protein